MRNAFISSVFQLAQHNSDIMVLVADNGAIVFDEFREMCPQQFLNCGIAEANMIGVAAGMASMGKVPFAYTIANFMVKRAFEQIRNDVALQEMNVKIVGIGGGVRYSTLGPTHHATEDLTLMRSLPGMTVICPASPKEAAKATMACAEINGPVYLRMATNGEPEIYEQDYNFEIGKGVWIREPQEVTFVANGPIIHEVLASINQLSDHGIKAGLLNIHSLKPLDVQAIMHAVKKSSCVLTVEEHSIIGSLGSAVAEVIAESGMSPHFERIGIKDQFCFQYGSYDQIKQYCGLDGTRLTERVLSVLEVGV